MTQIVPLAAVASQNLGIILDGQNCNLLIRTLSTGVYLDLISNGATIRTTAILRDRVLALLDAQYLGFTGDFAMIDTQGLTDPVYTGFGDRYQLWYFSAVDLGR